jgi:hypothetical protein
MVRTHLRSSDLQHLFLALVESLPKKQTATADAEPSLQSGEYHAERFDAKTEQEEA